MTRWSLVLQVFVTDPAREVKITVRQDVDTVIDQLDDYIQSVLTSQLSKVLMASISFHQWASSRRGTPATVCEKIIQGTRCFFFLQND